MTSRCRWVVVRDEKEGKKWQLIFPDGRVLKTIPVNPLRMPGTDKSGHGAEVDSAGHDPRNARH
jgi:hypothetical protein